MTNKAPVISLLLAASAVLSGCAGKTINYHTLRAQPGAAAVVAPGKAQPIIALRNLNLPGYLSDRDIIYLKGSSQIVQAEEDKWATPLSENLRQVLVEQLQSITNNPRILAYPLANNVRPERIIDVQINDFAALQEKNALLLRANWQITRAGKTLKDPAGYQFERSYTLKDPSIDSLMHAYQQATADLSVEISRTLN